MEVPNLSFPKFPKYSLFKSIPLVQKIGDMNSISCPSRYTRVSLFLSLFIGFATLSLGNTAIAQSDPVAGRKLGKIVIHVVPPKDMPDYGYRAWVQDY